MVDRCVDGGEGDGREDVAECPGRGVIPERKYDGGVFQQVKSLEEV